MRDENILAGQPIVGRLVERLDRHVVIANVESAVGNQDVPAGWIARIGVGELDGATTSRRRSPHPGTRSATCEHRRIGQCHPFNANALAMIKNNHLRAMFGQIMLLLAFLLLVCLPPGFSLPIHFSCAGDEDIMSIGQCDKRLVALGQRREPTMDSHPGCWKRDRRAFVQVKIQVADQADGTGEEGAGGTTTVPPPAFSQAAIVAAKATVLLVLPSATAPYSVILKTPSESVARRIAGMSWAQARDTSAITAINAIDFVGNMGDYKEGRSPPTHKKTQKTLSHWTPAGHIG